MADSEAFPSGSTVHVSFYGKALKKNADGSIVVKATSAGGSEVEVSIPASLIIPAKTYAVDTKVECNFRGKGKWYGASVIKVREDDTYDVLYDDGDKVRALPCPALPCPALPCLARTVCHVLYFAVPYRVVYSAELPAC